MTPESKAKELIGKMYQEIGFYPQAKKCALINVNETLSYLRETHDFLRVHLNNHAAANTIKVKIEYLEQVKKELEK